MNTEQLVSHARAARVRLELLAFGFAAAVIATAVIIALSFKEETFHVTGSPVDIRLVGVRPDASDEIFDVEGRRIGTRFYDGHDLNAWGSNALRRDFLFTLPAGQGVQPVGYSLQESGARYVNQTASFGWAGTDRQTYALGATFPDFYWRSGPFLGGQRPVEYVDITLNFYLAKRGQPTAQFQGPFTLGVTNKSPTAMATLILTAMDGEGGKTNTQFEFSSSSRSFGVDPLRFFDAEGVSHGPRITRTRSTGNSMEVIGSVPGVALSKIARVEVHAPLEKTFHHVRVRYPDRPQRTYPEVNDRLRDAFLAYGISNGVPPAQLNLNPITNASLMIGLVDTLRGAQMVETAWHYIAHASPPLQLTNLSPLLRPRVRRAVDAWIAADEPAVRAVGASLGLRCGWREFVAPAVRFLPELSIGHARDLLVSLVLFGPDLSEQQIEVICRRGLQEKESGLRQEAIRCLAANRSAAASNAVARLRAAVPP